MVGETAWARASPMPNRIRRREVARRTARKKDYGH